MRKEINQADALMQHAEQWRHIASPGHVLFARVNAYRHKIEFALYLTTAGLILAFSAAFIASSLATTVSKPVSSALGWTYKSYKQFFAESEPVKNPAPLLKSIEAKIPRSLSTESAALYPDLSVIEQAMFAASEQLKIGKGIEGCDTQSKLTDAWATAETAQPRCRMSADKSRLWVWGAALSGGSYGAYFVLLKKEDDKINIFNVNITDNTLKLNHEPVNAAFIPRTLAQDFSELVQK